MLMIIYISSYLSVRSISSFPSICSLTFLADIVVRSASLRIAKHKNIFPFHAKNFLSLNIRNLTKNRQFIHINFNFNLFLYLIYYKIQEMIMLLIKGNVYIIV